MLRIFYTLFFQSGDTERTVGHNRSRSLMKVLPPNCGCVGATSKFNALAYLHL